MTKFAGQVGYVSDVETSPGVWTAVDNPRYMRGDIIRQTSKAQNDNKVNSDVIFNHRVSLVGDAYAFDNYYQIKWIEVDGHKWKVDSVEVQRPRIIVSLGGPWNGR